MAGYLSKSCRSELFSEETWEWFQTSLRDIFNFKKYSPGLDWNKKQIENTTAVPWSAAS